MKERIEKMICGIIDSSDDLKKWKSYEEREINGVFPPVYKEIEATDPKSSVYSCVVVGLQTYMHEYTDCEIEQTWDATLESYLKANPPKAFEIFEYARDYAIVRMEIKRIKSKFQCDALFDALEDEARG